MNQDPPGVVSGADPAVWFPAVSTGAGVDIFTERLSRALNSEGIRSEITWLPHRAEYLPWSVRVPKPPAWANIAHINTWLHPRFLPSQLPVLATVHHAVHHPDALAWKGKLRAAYHNYWIAHVERRVLSQTGCAVAVSRFVAETTRRTLVEVPLQVIPNGVDTDSFRPGSRQRSDGQPFRLLYVGSWMTRKGVDLLAPIMRELGDGYELSYTGGSSVRLRPQERLSNMRDIGVLRSEDCVIAAMQAADAFVFPSRSEGFGLVLAEAMACGLPVIASDIPVVSELVEHGSSGVLCPTDNIGSFATAVRQVSNDASLYAKMAAAGRARSIATFSMSGMVREYIRSYRALLDRPACNLSPPAAPERQPNSSLSSREFT